MQLTWHGVTAPDWNTGVTRRLESSKNVLHEATSFHAKIPCQLVAVSWSTQWSSSCAVPPECGERVESHYVHVHRATSRGRKMEEQFHQ